MEEVMFVLDHRCIYSFTYVFMYVFVWHSFIHLLILSFVCFFKSIYLSVCLLVVSYPFCIFYLLHLSAHLSIRVFISFLPILHSFISCLCLYQYSFMSWYIHLLILVFISLPRYSFTNLFISKTVIYFNTLSIRYTPRQACVLPWDSRFNLCINKSHLPRKPVFEVHWRVAGKLSNQSTSKQFKKTVLKMKPTTTVVFLLQTESEFVPLCFNAEPNAKRRLRRWRRTRTILSRGGGV